METPPRPSDVDEDTWSADEEYHFLITDEVLIDSDADGRDAEGEEFIRESASKEDFDKETERRQDLMDVIAHDELTYKSF